MGPNHKAGAWIEEESSIVAETALRLAEIKHLLDGIGDCIEGATRQPLAVQPVVFNDMNEVGVHASQLSQCALKVMVTVISNAVDGRAMFDGGSKTFSGDRLISGDKMGFGYVTEHPDIKFYSMSEEHGHLDLTQSSFKPSVGEKLTIIPNHVCACVNMHDQINFHRKGIVEGSWTVAGRGKIR